MSRTLGQAERWVEGSTGAREKGNEGVAGWTGMPFRVCSPHARFFQVEGFLKPLGIDCIEAVAVCL